MTDTTVAVWARPKGGTIRHAWRRHPGIPALWITLCGRHVTPYDRRPSTYPPRKCDKCERAERAVVWVATTTDVATERNAHRHGIRRRVLTDLADIGVLAATEVAGRVAPFTVYSVPKEGT